MSNDVDARKRIRQMINFILQEAQEKAEEINYKSNEEFQIEKGRIINPERLKINQEFDHKIKDLEIKRKIEYSTQVNDARLQVLKRRGELMSKIENETFDKLQSLKSDKNNYKEILTRLIIQSLIRIDESDVLVKCVKEDYDICKSVMSNAESRYKELWKKEVGTEAKIRVTLDSKNFLPNSRIGGVEASARGNRIILDNTLPARLNVGKDSLLPLLRGHLFGVQEHIGVIYEEEDRKDDQ